MDGNGRTALITGASAGIGAAFARVFAQHGFNVVLTARREERLKALASEIEKSYSVRTTIIAANLADPDAPERIFAATKAQDLAIDSLINNAGFGLRGAFAKTRWIDQAAVLQVMATAVAHLSYLYLPGMIERRYGRILNVASMMGLCPGSPGMTLYGATKSFVVQLSETLHVESAAHGVHVTVTCPGYTKSEFHDVAGIGDVMARAAPRQLWMSAEDVASSAYSAVMAGRPRHIPGAINKLGEVVLTKLLPRRAVLALGRRLSAGLMEPLP